MFNQKLEFEFNVGLFILTLETDAYDMAVLLYKEFQYIMRANSIEENKQIVGNCVQSIIKTNQGSGMID